MSKAIELLEETRSKAQAMRDVLEGYELKIRDNVTTTDVAEFLYNAKIELDQAIESIDTILKPPATTGASEMSNEESKPDAKTFNRRIRILSNNDNFIAFNYSDNLDVRVTAKRTEDLVQPTMWRVSVEANGMLRLAGTIFGGKSVVNALVRALRNGMTSRQLKHRRMAANRRARKEQENN